MDSTSVTMTPAELVCLRERFGLTQAAMARMLNVSRRALAAWEAGQAPVPSWADDHISVLAEEWEGEVRRLAAQPDSTILIDRTVTSTGRPVGWQRSVAYAAAERSTPFKRISFRD